MKTSSRGLPFSHVSLGLEVIKVLLLDYGQGLSTADWNVPTTGLSTADWNVPTASVGRSVPCRLLQCDTYTDCHAIRIQLARLVVRRMGAIAIDPFYAVTAQEGQVNALGSWERHFS